MKRTASCRLDGSKTEQTLREAASSGASVFASYTLASEKAQSRRLASLGATLNDFAREEKEHTALWLSYLRENGTLEDDLARAAATDDYLQTVFYPEAARVAADEGFTEIADKFRMASSVNGRQADVCRRWQSALTDGACMKGDADAVWTCGCCGYTAHGNEPPEICPLCGYPKAVFARLP